MSGEDRDDIASWLRSERTNLIYRRASTKPSTPSPSPGVPTSWYDEPTGPSGTNPLWESFGIKKAGEANFVWSSPVSAVIDGRIYDGIGSDGTVNTGKVNTLSLQAGTVSVTNTTSGTDTYVAALATVTIMETGWIAVGDAIDGGAMIQMFAFLDTGTQGDLGGQMYLDIDTGSGYATYGQSVTGNIVSSGAIRFKSLMYCSASVEGVSSIKIRMRVQSILMPTDTDGTEPFYIRSPQIVVFGGQR
jgi:hypothetical protein